MSNMVLRSAEVLEQISKELHGINEDLKHLDCFSLMYIIPEERVHGKKR